MLGSWRSKTDRSPKEDLVGGFFKNDMETLGLSQKMCSLGINGDLRSVYVIDPGF